MRGVRIAYATPSRISSVIERPRWARGRPSARTASSAAITATKLRPLTKNARPTPYRAISRPATAGPTTRAALNIAELSAMAFIRSSLPTNSTMKDWRAGRSIVLATPNRIASTATCQ